MGAVKVDFEVAADHISLFERTDWRYAFGAIMRAVREDIRSTCFQKIIDRIEEQQIREAFKITETICMSAGDRTAFRRTASTHTSIAELNQHGLSVIHCEKGVDSVDFGVKRVQGLRISYMRSSVYPHNDMRTTRGR